MINVRFTETYHEEGPQGAAVVVLAGTLGEIIGSSFFSPISSDPTADPLPREVTLTIRTQGFKTGFNNPLLGPVQVREVPLYIVESTVLDSDEF